jgi:hypothetical protein
MQAALPITTDLDAALNETQTAEFLGVSTRTLQAWRVRGGGPSFMKLGRAVRYQRRELIAFQRQRTVSNTSEKIGVAATGAAASSR